jgi:hypothetical protein
MQPMPARHEAHGVGGQGRCPCITLCMVWAALGPWCKTIPPQGAGPRAPPLHWREGQTLCRAGRMRMGDCVPRQMHTCAAHSATVADARESGKPGRSPCAPKQQSCAHMGTVWPDGPWVASSPAGRRSAWACFNQQDCGPPESAQSGYCTPRTLTAPAPLRRAGDAVQNGAATPHHARAAWVLGGAPAST